MNVNLWVIIGHQLRENPAELSDLERVFSDIPVQYRPKVNWMTRIFDLKRFINGRNPHNFDFGNGCS